MRHPSSGYVQGINDVVTPFIVVFLSDYAQVNIQTLDTPDNFESVTEEQLNSVEADAYWCLCKILDRILDNYTSSWPGIQKSFQRMKEVVKRVDPQLLDHFESEGIDFYHMYFKWVTCLLLRQFSVKIGLRLFDTYLSDENNYFGFSLYILAAIILKFSKKFKKMSFEEMMLFQQNMPTKEWQEEDLSTVIAEAYVYQSYFLK
jgi:hypothetical protein